jgi:hypothetical protein
MTRKTITQLMEEALGRLPEVQKRQFIDSAVQILELGRTAKEFALTKRDADELEYIARTATSLHRALTSTTRPKSKTISRIRLAWQELYHDEYPAEFADALLVQIANAAKWSLPASQPRKRGRRTGGASADVLTAMALRKAYAKAFGKQPTVGGNSPFTKFCRAAFPAYRLMPVGAGRLADPLGLKREQNCGS